MGRRERNRKLNKIVREHCAGGPEALDAVELLHKISARHAEHTEAGQISRLAETKLNEIAEAMRDQARTWQAEESVQDEN